MTQPDTSESRRETRGQVFRDLLKEWRRQSEQIHSEWGVGPTDYIAAEYRAWLERWNRAA